MPLGRISSAAIDLDQRLATIVLVASVAESWHSGIRLPARTMASHAAQRLSTHRPSGLVGGLPAATRINAGLSVPPVFSVARQGPQLGRSQVARLGSSFRLMFRRRKRPARPK